MDLKLFLTIAVAMQQSSGVHAEWSFSGEIGLGPDRWAEEYPKCGASYNKQSPINIPDETEYDESLTPFEFHGYDSLGADDLEIENIGWTVKVNIKQSSIGTSYFTGGGSREKYTALQLHFHWGVNDTDKSGHNVHGHSYPLELHVVHFKESYGNLKNALNYSDGLALLTYLFEISETDNRALSPYLDELENVTHKGTKAPFGTAFRKFMGENTRDYYRYHGSMGEPPCIEAVVWTLFKDTKAVSSSQLAKLRQIYQTKKDASQLYKLTFNHRPLQKLKNRKVYRNFQPSSGSTAMLALLILIGCMLTNLI